MIRHHIFKDSVIIATTCNREAALDLIRQYQEKETHYMLRSTFSIIVGEEEFIDYPKTKNARQAR